MTIEDFLRSAYRANNDVAFDAGVDLVNELIVALKAHRRFHGKVGCPNGDDCYPCVQDDKADLAAITVGVFL